jgi:ankyrin repeat protein
MPRYLSKCSTPLHLACSVGHIECAKLLLQHGANVHAKDRCGRTALSIAKEKRSCSPIVQKLIAYGALQ